MSRLLIAVLVSVAVVSLAGAGAPAVSAVASGSVQIAASGELCDGTMTLTGAPGTAYCVHALQADGTYSLAKNGMLAPSGSATFDVYTTAEKYPDVPSFYVGYRSSPQEPMFWVGVTPTQDDDGFWLW